MWDYTKQEFVKIQQKRVSALKRIGKRKFKEFVEATREQNAILVGFKGIRRTNPNIFDTYLKHLKRQVDAAEETANLDYLSQNVPLRNLKSDVDTLFETFWVEFEPSFPNAGGISRRAFATGAAAVVIGGGGWAISKWGLPLPEMLSKISSLNPSNKNVDLSFKESDEYKLSLLNLTRVIYGEAGVCEPEEKLLVADIIFNRVHSPKFPKTLKEVVYQEVKGVLQFSCMATIKDKIQKELRTDMGITRWKECVKAADLKLEAEYMNQRKPICTGFYYLTKKRWREIETKKEPSALWWSVVIKKRVDDGKSPKPLVHLFSNMSYEDIEKEYVEAKKRNIPYKSNRVGVVRNSDYYVCRENSVCPATLIETGFLTNEGNAAYLDINALAIATQISKGIVAYIKTMDSTKKGKVVVLDAGHGGTDAGKTSTFSKVIPSTGNTESKVYAEKDIVLKITKLVVGLVAKKGITAYESRPLDTYVELKDRVSFTKKVVQMKTVKVKVLKDTVVDGKIVKAGTVESSLTANIIFVSIHADADTRPATCGPTVHYRNKNPVLKSQGHDLANVIYSQLSAIFTK